MDSGEDIIKANMKALEEADEKGEEVVLPFDEESALKEPEKPVDEPIEKAIDEPQDEPKETVEEPELDEIAKKDGYMSKEDWVASGKPEEDYMSKEDFAKVGELRDGDETRQQLSKKLVQMEAALKDVVTNQRSMIDDAKEQTRLETLAQLQEKKKEAIEFQDAEGAANIEREIVAAEKQEPAEAVAESNPTLDAWYAKNDSWYNVDANATSALNVQLQKHEKAGLPFEEGIELAMDVVKKHFPYHFDDAEIPAAKDQDVPTRVTQRAVETSSKKAASKKTKTFADLPESERKIAKAGAKMSGLTETEYMEQY